MFSRVEIREGKALFFADILRPPTEARLAGAAGNEGALRRRGERPSPSSAVQTFLPPAAH